MGITLIVLFILLGLALLITDILLVPGMILGLIGVGLMIIGIACSFYYYGMGGGGITFLATIFCTSLAIYLALRSKTWNRMSLNTTVEGKMNELDKDVLHVGDRGLAVSRLAPMGKMMFEGSTYEVESQEGFISENKQVVIVKINGNKIFVKLAG